MLSKNADSGKMVCFFFISKHSLLVMREESFALKGDCFGC